LELEAILINSKIEDMANNQKETKANNKIDGEVNKNNRTDGADTKMMNTINSHHTVTREATVVTTITTNNKTKRAMYYSDKESYQVRTADQLLTNHQ
jgi:hypothetical protein